MKRVVKTASQVVVLLVSAGVIAEILSGQLAEIRSYISAMDLALLVMSLPVLWAGMIVERHTWIMVMRSAGHRIKFFRGLHLTSMFQAASYVPGGFWHFIGIAYWTEEDKVPKKETAVATIINEGASVVVAATLFFSIAPLYLPDQSIVSYLPVALAVPGGLIALHPKVFYPALNRVLGYLGRETIDPRIEYGDLLKVFAVKTAARTLIGLTLYLIILSVSAEPLSLLPALVALYAGAWLIGFLVLFVPGGLGVREVAAISFFSAVMTRPLSGLVVLVFRAISLPSEFLFALVFWILDSRRQDYDADEGGVAAK